MSPRVGDVYETVAYPGHLYVVVGADDVEVAFVILAAHPRIPEATPGKRFTLPRESFKFALDTTQMARMG